MAGIRLQVGPVAILGALVEVVVLGSVRRQFLLLVIYDMDKTYIKASSWLWMFRILLLGNSNCGEVNISLVFASFNTHLNQRYAVLLEQLQETDLRRQQEHQTPTLAVGTSCCSSDAVNVVTRVIRRLEMLVCN